MKSCKEIEAGLYVFTDRQERKNIPAELLEHLQVCDRCSKLYASLEQVETMIARGSEVSLPPENYFEKLPGEILKRLPAEKSARKGMAVLPVIAAWFAGIFPRPFVKPVFALAMFAIVAVAVWRNLPEGAQITFVNNTKKINKIKSETPAETGESPQALTAAGPETDLLLEESATIPKEDALQTAGASKPQKAAAMQESEPMPDSALSLFAQADLQQNQGQTIQQSEPEPAADLNLRTVAPPAVPANLKMAEGVEKKGEMNVRALAEIVELEKKFAELSKQSSRSLGKAGDVSTAAKKSRVRLPGKGAVGFADYLRMAQSAASDRKRVAIWRRFLASTQDSTQYALGLEQLAGAIKANADQSSEVHELADAVAWFEQHETALKPLMGEKDFEQQFTELRVRLQKARTGKLK